MKIYMLVEGYADGAGNYWETNIRAFASKSSADAMAEYLNTLASKLDKREITVAEVNALAAYAGLGNLEAFEIWSENSYSVEEFDVYE